ARAERGEDDAGRSALAEIRRRHLDMARHLGLERGDREDAERDLDAVLEEVAALLDAARLRASRPLPAPTRARLLAAGERLSAPLLARAIGRAGREAQALDAADLVVSEPGDPLDARVDFRATRPRVLSALGELPEGTVAVVTGFAAATPEGEPALLGRGGSDTTATVLGAILDAERVEIWTDVDGVLTGDPRRDANATLLPRLSYAEAERRALGGAVVLHPRSVAPAARAGVPILVRNSFRPERPGTWIGPAGSTRDSGSPEPPRPPKARRLRV
ncbi:MAG: bifunctional aspartate kinase/homoserine dehydrogenase I, partial [Acidobacteriota bacterium]